MDKRWRFMPKDGRSKLRFFLLNSDNKKNSIKLTELSFKVLSMHIFHSTVNMCMPCHLTRNKIELISLRSTNLTHVVDFSLEKMVHLKYSASP